MLVRRAALGVVAAAMCLAGTACGSDEPDTSKSAESTSGSSPTDGGGADAAVQQAIEELQTYDNPQPAVEIPPLSKPAPTDKDFVIMTCPLPICTLWTDGALDAAKVLGWNTKTVTTQFTPESFASTWDSIIQNDPDVIMFVGANPIDSVRDKIQEAADQGAIVVAYALGEDVGGSDSPIVYGASGPNDVRQQGKVLALQAIADAGAPPNVALVADPAVPVQNDAIEASKEEVEKVGGTFGVIEVSQATIGQQVPGQVVTYLQSHPDVEYVLLAFDDLIAGVPQAMKAAGITDVKIIGTAASSTSAKMVASGELYSTAVHPTNSNSWYAVDAAVRAMIGDPIKDPNPAGLITTYTPDNADAVGNPDFWPAVADAFTKAWGR